MAEKVGGRIGIRGWVYAGRYGLERYAYTLHRITGLGLLLYFILHIFFSSVRLSRDRGPGKGLWPLSLAPSFTSASTWSFRPSSFML